MSRLLLACAALVAGKASAQNVDWQPSFPILGELAEVPLADLVVDGVFHSTIDFLMDGNDRPLLKSTMLRREIGGYLRPEIVDAIDEWERYVAPDELESFGIDVSYDAASLKLSISIAPAAMRLRELTTGPKSRMAEDGQKISTEPFSIILDASFRLEPSLVDGVDEDRFVPRARLQLNPSVYLFGFVAQADAQLSFASETFDGSIKKARLTRNFPEIGARAVAGMIEPRVDALQNSTQIVGLSFYRERSLPGGRGKPQPVIDELVLDRKAEISVELNGMVARRFRLEPGSYRLSELSLASGLNDITIKINEDGVEPREMKVGIPFDAAILRDGELDYAISLGADAKDLLNPLASAFVAAGIGRFLEIGADAQVGNSILLGGLSALAATPIGNIGGAAALAMNFEDRSAPATSFSSRLFWRLSLAGLRFAPKLGAAAEYVSAGFARPLGSNSSAFDRATDYWTFSGQVAQSLSANLGNVSVFGDAKLVEGSVSRWGASAGYTVSLPNSILASLSCGAEWTIDAGYTPRASIGVSISPPDNKTLRYSQDLLNRGTSLGVSLPVGEEGRESLTASVSKPEGSHGLDSAYFGYQSAIGAFDVALGGEYGSDEIAGTREFQGKIEVSSAFAFARGTFAFADPTGDAFLLLIPSPSLATERIEVRVVSGPVVSKQGDKPVLISGLRPYFPFRAAIDLPESSPDRRISPAAIEIFPAYRSISVVKVRDAAATIVRGLAVDGSGQPLRELAGDFYHPDGTKIPFSGTFTDEDGYFECYGIEPGRYEIRWSDGSACGLEISEDEDRGFIDIGVVETTPIDASGGADQ